MNIKRQILGGNMTIGMSSIDEVLFDLLFFQTRARRKSLLPNLRATFSMITIYRNTDLNISSHRGI